MSEQAATDEEAQARIEALREINRRHKAGEISEEERVRLHNEVVEGIGNLNTEAKRREAASKYWEEMVESRKEFRRKPRSKVSVTEEPQDVNQKDKGRSR